MGIPSYSMLISLIFLNTFRINWRLNKDTPNHQYHYNIHKKLTLEKVMILH